MKKRYRITVAYSSNNSVLITFIFRYKFIRNIVYKLIKDACPYCEVYKWHIAV